MASTTLTTWTRLTGSTFEQGFDLDPNWELDLSEDDRNAMNDAARTRLIKSADKFLMPYAAQMLGNGEIILDLDTNARTWNESAEESFREMLADIDYDDILATV